MVSRNVGAIKAPIPAMVCFRNVLHLRVLATPHAGPALLVLLVLLDHQVLLDLRGLQALQALRAMM